MIRGRARVLAVVAGLGLVFAGDFRVAHADGIWLDQRPVVNWNTPGASVPTAPLPTFPEEAQCVAAQRPPETNEDQQVVAAGWGLLGGYASGWGMKVIVATSDYSGMCQPLGYQEFVFVDAVFAGTVAPAPMGPRQDGGLDITSSATISGPDTLGGVTFGRRLAGDSFCCTSGRNGATYTIDRSNGGPVLLVTEVYTLPSR